MNKCGQIKKNGKKCTYNIKKDGRCGIHTIPDKSLADCFCSKYRSPPKVETKSPPKVVSPSKVETKSPPKVETKSPPKVVSPPKVETKSPLKVETKSPPKVASPPKVVSPSKVETKSPPKVASPPKVVTPPKVETKLQVGEPFVIESILERKLLAKVGGYINITSFKWDDSKLDQMDRIFGIIKPSIHIPDFRLFYEHLAIDSKIKCLKFIDKYYHDYIFRYFNHFLDVSLYDTKIFVSLLLAYKLEVFKWLTETYEISLLKYFFQRLDQKHYSLLTICSIETIEYIFAYVKKSGEIEALADYFAEENTYTLELLINQSIVRNITVLIFFIVDNSLAGSYVYKRCSTTLEMTLASNFIWALKMDDLKMCDIIYNEPFNLSQGRQLYVDYTWKQIKEILVSKCKEGKLTTVKFILEIFDIEDNYDDDFKEKLLNISNEYGRTEIVEFLQNRLVSNEE